MMIPRYQLEADMHPDTAEQNSPATTVGAAELQPTQLQQDIGEVAVERFISTKQLEQE
jgi:hypothetical protein